VKIWVSAGVGVAIVAAISAVAVIALTTGSRSAGSGAVTASFPPRVPTPKDPRFPAPPQGAVVFAGPAGKYAVGLAVVPSRGVLRLQVSLATIRGVVPYGLPVTLELVEQGGNRRMVEPTLCGRGCYRAVVSSGKPPVRIDVKMRFPTKRLSFVMPRPWPPPKAQALVARLERAWRRLHTLVFHETVSTAGSAGYAATWTIVGPDKLSVVADDGSQAKIIVGDRAWYRVGKGPWLPSEQVPIHQPVPYWRSAVNARLLGTVHVGGRAAWRVSFFNPGTPAWFSVDVEKKTSLPLQVRMVAAQHFVRLTYRDFDEPQSISPPTGSRSR
jgi:hypothetical protein